MSRQRSILDQITDAPASPELFTPHLADLILSRMIFTDTRDMVRYYGRQLMYDGNWSFYGVTQSRGRCYYNSQTITIPAWVLKTKPLDYKEWYVSHEMAHAYNWINGTNDHHGPNFMALLRSICPKDCIHYELEYKPRNAASAGIKVPEHLRTKVILDNLL